MWKWFRFQACPNRSDNSDNHQCGLPEPPRTVIDDDSAVDAGTLDDTAQAPPGRGRECMKRASKHHSVY